MEVTAVIEALGAYPSGEITIVSDSTYVVNCFRDKWWDGWLKRGWLNSAKKPVANRDLWEPLIETYLARRDELTFQWVKGHGADAMNAKADALAVEASLTQRPVAG
jgi:ribonuclease HI